MNKTTTINVIIAGGLLIVAGKWAKGEDLTPRIAVGTFFTAAMLSMLAGADPKLAGDLALLILVGIILAYGPAVFKAIDKATS